MGNKIHSKSGRLYDCSSEMGFLDLLSNKIMPVRMFTDNPELGDKEKILQAIDEIIAGIEIRRAELRCSRLINPINKKSLGG